MKAGFLILLLILVLKSNSALSFLGDTSQTADQSINRQVGFTVAVVFAGYDNRSVDVAEIARSLRTTYQRDILVSPEDPASAGKLTYSLTFDFFFSGPSYTQALNDFVSRHSSEALTSGLDVGALMEQRRTGRRARVFFPLRGISVDAVALENWLQQNPFTSMPVPGYTFYVLNLSHLDSPSGVYGHWFDPGIRDPDSGRAVNWFRLEWDNQLNLPVRPAYAGWGNASRLFFLDPSAYQWYLKWAAVWWEGRTKDPLYSHDFTSLTEFVKGRDIHTSRGRSDLARYLAGWIDQLTDGLVRRDKAMSRIYSDALVDVLIINGAQGGDVADRDLAWTTSEEAVILVMNDIAPFMRWGFNITIRDIDTYPRLKHAVLDNSTREDGRLHVPGADVWDFFRREAASLFDLDATDLVIPCLVIVMNETSMMVEGPAGLGEFTGLGGDQKVLVMKELSRYYFPGNDTPKSGLTSVLVHELGHNLGLNHTFPPYCTDFAGDVMGYLSHSAHFTRFMKDSFQRNTFDSIYMQMTRNASQIQEEKKRSVVQGLMEDALLLYNKMSYLDALDKLQQAVRLAQPSQVTVVTTTSTITRVRTHASGVTLTHTITATVTTTATRDDVDLPILLALFALFLTVALALTMIWITWLRRKPDHPAANRKPIDRSAPLVD